jgi:fibronectin type 3 domain-containing protein
MLCRDALVRSRANALQTNNYISNQVREKMRAFRLLLWAVALCMLVPLARSEVAQEGVVAPAGEMTATAGKQNVTLTWPRVVDAVWYNLYWQRIGTAGTNKIVNVSSPFVHERLASGATYHYQINAGYAGGERETSLAATVTLAPGRPQNVDAQATEQTVSLQWEPVSGAQHYRIYWNTSGKVTTSDPAITATQVSYAHQNLRPGARYYYRIAAQNAGGEGELSREATVQLTSATPVIASAVAGENDTTLSWPPVAAAESYHLYWNTAGNVTKADTKIEYVSSAFIHTGRVRGATYYYRLSALNLAGESELSPEISVTFAPVAPVPQARKDSDRVMLDWAAVSGASSYHVYWDTRPGVTGASHKVADATSPFAPSGLQAGETYYYRVAAVNAGGETLSGEVVTALRPAAPVISQFDKVPRQITLQWAPVIGAQSYTLYWNTRGDVGVADNKVTGVTFPWLHTGLSNGVTYYYRLAASNIGGDSALSAEVHVVMAPDAPVLAAAQGGDKRVTLRWSGVPSSTLYTVYWNTRGDVGVRDEKVTTKDIQWVHEALRNGSKYYYRVSAQNAGGESDLAPQVAVTLAPDAPRAEIAAVGERDVTLRWNPTEGAAAYHVYWNTGGNVSTRDNKLAGVTPPFVHPSLHKGETYFYLVTAANEGGETASAPLQATLLPETPGLPVVLGGDKQITLSWKAVNGAVAYRIYWNNKGDVASTDARLDVSTSSIVHTGVANGGVYFYRIAASNTGGESPLSTETKVTLAPDAPVVAAPVGGDKQVTLAWERVFGASAYNIYWNTSGDVISKDQKISSVTAPYIQKNLANGLTYHYQITAVNAGGETTAVPVSVTLAPDAPVVSSASAGDKQTIVQWGAMPGASAYTVYWNASGKVSERDAKLDALKAPLLHTGLKNGGTYYYRLSARNDAGASALSTEFSATLAPEAPLLQASQGGDRISTLRWTPMFGATGYRVYWNTTGKVTAKDEKLTSTEATLVHSALVRGMTYYYRIAAFNGGGETLAPEFSVALAPDATTLSNLKGADKQITLAWKTASGATEYHIYWNTTGKVTEKDAQLKTSAASLLHANINNGVQYFYRIAASNAGGESELSPEVAVTLAPDAPVINVTNGEDKRITLGWTPVRGAESYTIYWKLAASSDAKFTKVPSAVAPYVLSGLSNNTKYAYRVAAVNSGGEGYPSEQRVVTPHNQRLSGLFSDLALQQCINGEAAINGWVYGDEVTGILVCNELGISNLSGVEWLENVTNLSLRSNRIDDVSKLSGLARLGYLALDGNNITNLKPLAALTKLNYLSLNGNPVSDISSLSALISLTSLYLNDTKTASLSPLSNSLNLVYLSVYNSEIVDVGPLAGLKSLARLYLGGNHIVDIGPVAVLTNLTELDVSSNELGGRGVGHVDALVALKNARLLQVGGNSALSCEDATSLIKSLRSPPVDLDGIVTNIDLVVDGENCVNP